MIDLHVHSTFSDGSLTPVALVELAEKDGLSAMALSDHDTTDGIPLFLEACKGRKLIGIAGVEISADFNPGTMHILGYFFDPSNSALAEALFRMRNGREVRNKLILEKLNKLGLKITWEDVLKFTSEDVVGRPHFAQALLAKGYISDFKKAFEQYLGKGKPAYADRFRLTPEDSIRVIREAGGVAVLGHPVSLGVKDDNLRELVKRLAGAGLRGIEVFYPEHKQKQVQQYSAIAKEFGLVLTGGSDFHGTITPDIRLGRGFGSLCVDDELLVPLRVAAGRE